MPDVMTCSGRWFYGLRDELPDELTYYDSRIFDELGREMRAQAQKKMRRKRPKILTPAVRLRLMMDGKKGATKQEMSAYYSSPHWSEMKKLARTVWAGLLGRVECVMCGSVEQEEEEERLQVHHLPRAYNKLFREDPLRDLRIICPNCHKRHERGR